MIAIFLISLVAAAPQLLVTPDRLQQEMNAWQIVDTRSAEDYANAHIPGARNLNPDLLSEVRNEVVGVLRPLDEVTRILAEAGLDPDKPVLVYSDLRETNDLKQATRLFWVLEYLSYTHVAILDGGYAAWLRDGKPVATHPTLATPIELGKLQLRPREELLATREEVAQVIETKKGVLIDNRSNEQYSGIAQSGAVAKAGHINGARNVPATELVNEDTFTLKQGEALNEATADVPDEADTPVISYCNTGRDASVGYFALRVKGKENVSLYDGSMSEWSRLPQLQIQE